MPIEQELDVLDSQIADLSQRRDALRAQKQLTDVVLQAATPRQKSLAIALHGALCVSSHLLGVPNACRWAEHESSDDAEAADWTDIEHQTWLKRAQKGIELLRQLGYGVTDPDEGGTP